MKTPDLAFTIDGQEVVAREGQTILSAALAAGVHIPHLCHDPRLVPIGACRMCLVEIEGQPGLHTACTRLASEGMVVRSESETVRAARKGVLELMLSAHRVGCATCDRDGDCLLQDYAYEYGADDRRFGVHEVTRGRNYTSLSKAIAYDVDRCIRCWRCVRFCAEVQMAEALTVKGRSCRAEVSTAFDVDLIESTCELCGGCISTCPTGAMMDRAAMGKGRSKDLDRVRTTCAYCGVGCQLDLNVHRRTGRVVRVTSEVGGLPNDGNLCVKGKFGFQFIHSPERLTHPMIREGGALRRASWEEAIGLVGRRMREIRDAHGPEAVAFMSSSRCTNEENYLVQKLARTAGGTNNVDQCATTCHAPSVAGLAAAFGSGAMTNAIGEIKDVHTIFMIGANPTEAHPIVGLELKKALRKGARLIVCDPRRTWFAERADVWIQHRAGTDNFLLNAMMHHILEQGLHDRKFIAERCENFEAFRENVCRYSVEEAARVCGVEADLIRRAAEMYAVGAPSSIFYTLGITEHTCGTENVQNIANLAMLCGQIGKSSSGVNPLRGQNNVQGACDMGAMPHRLPGYQDWKDEAVRRKFEGAWDADLPMNPGGRVPEFIERAGQGIVKGMFVMGEDPAVSDPNRERVMACLRRLEFLAVQEIFMSETAKLAHVILPGACFAEKDGTFTNTERRVQRVRKAVDPPGEAKADWQILCLVSTAMGYPMAYGHPSEIWDEMARLTPSFAGIDYARIDRVGLQWPCPTKDHPGTPYLHAGQFTRGRGRFHVIRFRPPAEEPDEAYPMLLSTGRTLYHYNAGNMTRKTEAINQKQSENFVEVHAEDAQRIGVRDGDFVRVSTRRGALTVRAAVGEKVRPGALWMPFHFVETPTNVLTNDAFDDVTCTAEYKCCAAKIERA